MFEKRKRLCQLIGQLQATYLKQGQAYLSQNLTYFHSIFTNKVKGKLNENQNGLGKQILCTYFGEKQF